MSAKDFNGSYDFKHEAERIVEALDLNGARMTLICALREAFEAGRAAARDTPQESDRERQVRLHGPNYRPIYSADVERDLDTNYTL